MAASVSQLHFLALESVFSALSLVARSLSSVQVPDALLVNQRIMGVRAGSPESLVSAIASLNMLARSREFDDFRKAIQALKKSLPCLFVTNFSQADKDAVIADLGGLQSVASSLQAPEVVERLGQIIEKLKVMT